MRTSRRHDLENSSLSSKTLGKRLGFTLAREHQRIEILEELARKPIELVGEDRRRGWGHVLRQSPPKPLTVGARHLV